MRTLVFDIETNGLLDRVDLRVHCISIEDRDAKQMYEYSGDDLMAGVRHLRMADRLVGHNIVGFDIPVLENLFGFDYDAEIFDTYLASRLVYASNLYGYSIRLQRSRGKTDEERNAAFPSQLLGAHSLKAWGYRLGLRKGEHLEKTGADEEWSPELQEYCSQDVRVCGALYDQLRREPAAIGWKLCSIESILVESQFGLLLSQQERNGIRFDERAAADLYGKLVERRLVLTKELQALYPPFAVKDGKTFTPKRTATRPPTAKWPHVKEYVAGVPFQKMQMVDFNPGSGQHVANCFVELYGWKPKEFTDSGLPTVDEKVLNSLSYPGVKELLEYGLIKKRLGQISEGNKAWLKHVSPEGLIHGRVHATGTRTSRCAHFQPNLGQVPSVTSPYGAECRDLFSPVAEGRVMVGIDASGLELRMLASRLAYFDGGAFGKTLLEGDPHVEWMKSTGIHIRSNQKTWTYACLYGAGDRKLGLVILDDWRQAFAQGLTKEKVPGARFARELGKASRGKLLSDNVALEMLLKACKVAQKRGYLVALDGRVLACKTEHGALNDLLQSDGAIVMKHAKVIFDDAVTAYELKSHFNYLLDVHDEWQLESDSEYAKAIGEEGCDAIRKAGEKLGVRVPLDAEFKIGATWKDTH